MYSTRHITKEEHNKRIKLHESGYTNIEMARLCGVTRVSMYHWIIRNGLKCNKKSKNSSIQYKGKYNAIVKENEKRIELYLKGRTDKQIARRLKRSIRTIQKWRQNLHLKTNKKKSNNETHRFRYTPLMYRRIAPYYFKGLNDDEISYNISRIKRVVQSWRYRNNLQEVNQHTFSRLRFLWGNYDITDEQLAKECNFPLDTVKEYLFYNKLKSHNKVE